jgi:hypothetical protein
MYSAKQLEKEFANESVRLAMPGVEGNGVLALKGRNTFASITASEWIGDGDPITGWFDLVLEQANGSKVLLHNALTTSSGIVNRDRREWKIDVFPNIVVLRAEHILPSNKIRTIQFTAKGLEDLFYYEIAEWHSLYRASPNAIKSIKQLRQIERAYPRKYEYFSPRSVYLIHELPRVLRERVGNRTYEIFLGHSESHSGRSLMIKPLVIGTIQFDETVSIDIALDAVWAWRRFFGQIAMKPLPFQALSCRAKIRRTDQSSDLYLPNMNVRNSEADRHIFEFGPGNVPYGQWKHRKKFSDVMRRWLELDSKRRPFRVRLENVLEEMQRESSPRLIAALCGAIESLSEMQQQSALNNKDFEDMIAAAAAVGANATPPVLSDRIRGVLSMLQYRSLPQRLKLVAAALEPTLPKPDARNLIKIALKIRTFEAHGDHWDVTIPPVTPALEMLASMCVLWDLTTSGMPAVYDERKLTAASRITFYLGTCARK